MMGFCLLFTFTSSLRLHFIKSGAHWQMENRPNKRSIPVSQIWKHQAVTPFKRAKPASRAPLEEININLNRTPISKIVEGKIFHQAENQYKTPIKKHIQILEDITPIPKPLAVNTKPIKLSEVSIDFNSSSSLTTAHIATTFGLFQFDGLSQESSLLYQFQLPLILLSNKYKIFQYNILNTKDIEPIDDDLLCEITGIEKFNDLVNLVSVMRKDNVVTDVLLLNYKQNSNASMKFQRLKVGDSILLRGEIKIFDDIFLYHDWRLIKRS